MTMTLIETHNALKEAGAPEDIARAATRSVTGSGWRLDELADWLKQVEPGLEGTERWLGVTDQGLASVTKPGTTVQALIVFTPEL